MKSYILWRWTSISLGWSVGVVILSVFLSFSGDKCFIFWVWSGLFVVLGELCLVARVVASVFRCVCGEVGVRVGGEDVRVLGRYRLVVVGCDLGVAVSFLLEDECVGEVERCASGRIDLAGMLRVVGEDFDISRLGKALAVGRVLKIVLTYLARLVEKARNVILLPTIDEVDGYIFARLDLADVDPNAIPVPIMVMTFEKKQSLALPVMETLEALKEILITSLAVVYLEDRELYRTILNNMEKSMTREAVTELERIVEEKAKELEQEQPSRDL